MKTPARPEEPAKHSAPSPDRGAPTTYAAHAVRKNLAVRVVVKPTQPESDELREHGYGHGV